MRNLSGHQGENERVKKSEQQQVRHSSIKRATRKFREVSRCGRAKQRQRKKKVCCKCKVVFLLIRPIVVVSTV